MMPGGGTTFFEQIGAETRGRASPNHGYDADCWGSREKDSHRASSNPFLAEQAVDIPSPASNRGVGLDP